MAKRYLLTALAVLLVAGALGAQQVKVREDVLPNGMKLLLVERHDSPTVSCGWVAKVGSVNESPGITGISHLFEHMMFKGSENVGPGEHFYLIFTNGGSMNGTTNNDRTLYFEIMPKNQLDLALFLEADRMRALKVTQESLDNQRQAVKEERRLGVDNQPYGQSFEKMDELVYDNFAYKHSVIGSMVDLDAASVDDVQQFFKTYYAPNNAVLALAGDLNTKDTLAKVRKYFGPVPRQTAPTPVDLAEPERKEERRVKIDDKLARVPRIDIAYRIPESNSPDGRALSVAGSILGGGESSRLYQKLVKEKEVATTLFAGVNGRAGPSKFQITAMVRPGKTPEDVEALISEEISRLISEPVTDKELQRARTGIRRGALGPRQSALSTAITLADDAALYNDPGRINTDYEKRLAVTAQDVQQAAKTWLRTANRVTVITVPAAMPMPKPPASKQN